MRVFLVLLLTLMVSQTTWGRLYVEIHFLRYMDDCDEDLGTSKCDPQFTFCLDRPDSSNSISRSQCTYRATSESSHYQNTDDLNLESKTSIGGIPNPWKVEIDKLLDPSVKLVVRVRDDDYFGDDHLETWNTVLTETIYESREEAIYANRNMRRNDHTMYFKIRIYCDTNYFLPDCTKFCLAEDLPTGHYTCEKGTGDKVCMRGYTGPNCTEDIDECALGFCARGDCENLQGDYICHCPEHFTGKNCTNPVDYCDFQPCKNNATCENMGDSHPYTCHCTENWEGEHCELPLDPCKAEPCQNGGSCISNANHTAYTCDCTYLYLGIHCETRNENVSTTPITNANDGGGKTGQLKSEDDDGFLLWHGILICIIILIIVVICIVCLVVRRRRRKQEKAPVGLPPGNTVVMFNGGDNLAFENTMYNDVNRNGGTRQTPLPATPTTPTEDELFNPVKPVFHPDDVEAQGAVGGGYHEMDADGYVKPSKFNVQTEGKEIEGQFQNERAQNNPYADFSAIHLKPLQATGREDEDESHYQDLDEVASAVQDLDDAVRGNDDGMSTGSANSDAGFKAGPDLPSKRSKVPDVPTELDNEFPPPYPSDDDYEDASVPPMLAPKPPQGTDNPYTEPVIPSRQQTPPVPAPKPKPSHYEDVPINTPRNSDPFSDKAFDDEEDPQHFGLPSTSVDDGGYATPKGSQRGMVPLTTQESQYDSPRNSRSARSSANSEYDSPRSSPMHRPAPPPPKVAPKPPARSVSVKDQPDGNQNTEVNGQDGHEVGNVEDFPRSISVREGFTFDNDDNDNEMFETNVDDDEAEIKKPKSNPHQGLFLENHAFMSE